MRRNGNMAFQALYELISELMDELDRDEVMKKAFEKIRLAVDPNLVAISKALGRLASCEVVALQERDIEGVGEGDGRGGKEGY